MVLFKLDNDHKAETHSKYREEKKEYKHANSEKSSNHNERELEKKKRTKELQKSQKTMNKMAIPFLLIITLNVNGINSPIKKHIVPN